MLTIVPGLANAANHSVVQVGTGDVALDLELSLPASTPARAVVVIVPGSGGLSDPYFDTEIRQPEYDYTHRGGLTDMLTSAGYAVAAYSVRGYRGTSCIPAHSAPADRAAYFVARCTDQEVRGRVTMSDLTNDAKRVFSYLRLSPETSSLKRVALAYSEGMYHVVDAHAAHTLDSLAGIVAIGGPHESLRSTLAWQLTRGGDFQAIDAAFKDCGCRAASVEDILAINHKGVAFDRAGLLETMGSDPIEREDVPIRKAFWRERYRQLYERFAPNTLKGTMDGVLDGARIGKAWSLDYYSQLLANRQQPQEVLRRFDRPVTYLYGLDDVLVRIPSRAIFAETERGAAGPRKLRLVPDADHGLSTGGLPSPDTLAAIRDAIDDVVSSRPCKTPTARKNPEDFR